MNALEKLASAASLVERMKSTLYGDKPSMIKRVLGGAGIGAGVGAAATAKQGIRAGRKVGAAAKAIDMLPGGKSADRFVKSDVLRSLRGGAGAGLRKDTAVAAGGIAGGAALGAGAGALSGRSALKAYAKRRKVVNAGLGAAAGAGGLAGLAGLLGKKNK